MLQGRFVVSAIVFAFAATLAVLTATGILPGPTAVIDAWSVTRPTLPRRWLKVAFWSILALPVAACGILVGTAGQVLSAAWSDAAQFLLWLALAVDAAIGRRRLLLALAVVFLAFSAHEVATRL